MKQTISLDKKAYDTVLGFLKKSHKTGKIEALDWNEFRMDLEKVIVQEEQVKAIDLWTMENLEQHHPETIRHVFSMSLSLPLFRPNLIACLWKPSIMGWLVSLKER